MLKKENESNELYKIFEKPEYSVDNLKNEGKTDKKHITEIYTRDDPTAINYCRGINELETAKDKPLMLIKYLTKHHDLILGANKMYICSSQKTKCEISVLYDTWQHGFDRTNEIDVNGKRIKEKDVLGINFGVLIELIREIQNQKICISPKDSGVKTNGYITAADGYIRDLLGNIASLNAVQYPNSAFDSEDDDSFYYN